MLQIKNLSIWMNRDHKQILNQFSFSLQPGDRAAIIGEEGNGKSTLLRILAGDPQVEQYAAWEGTISGNQKQRIGWLKQELSEEEKKMSVSRFYAARGVAENDLYDALSSGTTTDFFEPERQVGTLSGGEKVRLQLTAVMARQPEVLLLDEPTNDLDLETLSWLETFLLRCRRPVLYVSHDETLLERTANVIIHLEQVRKKSLCRHTIARCGYREYVSRRAGALQRQEQLARKERADQEKKQARLQQIFEKVEYRQNTISRGDPAGGRLLKKKMHAVKSMERRFERESESMTQLPDTEEAIGFDFGSNGVPDGKPVLRFQLDCLQAGERILARQVRLNVTGGEHIGITGTNGAGKTTLLKRMAEQLLQRSDLHVGYMPQNYADALNGSQPVLEYLAPSGRKDDITAVRTLLGSLKFMHEEAEGTIEELSGGQKAKLLFAGLIFSGSNVLILDEPTRNFSPLSNPVIRSALRRFPGAIVSVSHDRKFLAEVCDTVYQLTESGLQPVGIDDEEIL
ncbi:MAG: ATP-binding cassette domain-containing protein [Acutalibacteraceae bacterium]|jgi:ATPase subunit of ABC transporter with duplicated ATPase domains